jgi:hypothetical protein
VEEDGEFGWVIATYKYFLKEIMQLIETHGDDGVDNMAAVCQKIRYWQLSDMVENTVWKKMLEAWCEDNGEASPDGFLTMEESVKRIDAGASEDEDEAKESDILDIGEMDLDAMEE